MPILRASPTRDYVIRLRPGIRYQPHPAFARRADGSYAYYPLAAQELADKHELRDFPHTDSRELTAEDYVYGIKRLAHPRLHSPILGLMQEYIVGLGDFADATGGTARRLPARGTRDDWLDLRQFAARGRRGARPLHLPHPHQGQVSAVRRTG